MVHPISPDSHRTLVLPYFPSAIRTGTIPDGSCFFHALFYAISTVYRKYTIQQRKHYIQSQRKSIANKVDWNLLSQLEFCKVQLMMQLGDILPDNIITYIANNWNNQDINELVRITHSKTPISIPWNRLFENILQSF